MSKISASRGLGVFSELASSDESSTFTTAQNQQRNKIMTGEKANQKSPKRRKLDSTISQESCSHIQGKKLPFDCLYSAIRDKSWDYVRQILNRPDAASYLRYGGGAMFIACNRNAPTDIIKSLHEISPGQITQKSANGWLPLHWAARCSSIETVDLILKISPAGCTIIQELNGMTPLHLAMAENIDPFIISRLLLENPKALRIKDKYGRTPLEQFFKMWKSHLLRRQTQNHSEWTKKRIVTKDSIQAIIQVLSHGKLDKLQSDEWLPIHEAIKLRNIIHPIFIKPLISQFPKELQRKDPDKQNLPLHVAAAQNSANTDLWMQVLLQEYPGAATVRNKSGRLPFNLMVESGKEWKKSTGWTKLIEAAPGAISMKDNKTKLYPFMAACACTETSLDVAYRLLKQDPTQVTGGILSNNKK